MSAGKKVDRWKAVRKGKIYCAPACGHNCTYLDYLQARHRAKEAAKKLGKGWTFEVWENLGWHSKVISPDKYVHIYIARYDTHDSYLVMVGPEKNGSSLIEWNHTADTLEEALDGVFKKIHGKILRLNIFTNSLLSAEYWPKKKRVLKENKDHS